MSRQSHIIPAIRLATEADLPSINDIYNHYVLTSTCTYQEEPDTLESRHQWFASHRDVGPHPVTVALESAAPGAPILGWGCLSTFRARSAYRFTVENTVYVHHLHHQRGIGSAILADLINRARAIGHRSIIAGIDSAQTGSIALHARHGFVTVGQMRQIGFKFNQWLDVVFMQRFLDPANSSDQTQNNPPR